MSPEIGRLTNLQTLSKFIVGKQNMPGLKELMNVRLLRGSISIQELQNVTDARDENEANSWAGQDIEELELAWSSEFNDLRKEKLELDVLAKLKPHKHLKRLTIEFYGGTKFPSWIGDPSFSEIVKLTLGGCRKCRSLPALGQLPKLKKLHIRGMHGVQKLGVEFYKDDFCLGHPFPSLESLIFEDMPAWDEWSCSIGVEEATSQFPCLRVFRIIDCPKLIRVPLLRLPSLETLYLEECHEAVLKSIVDVQSLVGLQSLVIIGCNQLVFFAKTGFSPTLKSLTIRKCEALTSLPDGMCGLESLEIEECSSLTSLPDGMCGLEHLEINRCSSLTSWPTVGLPTALKVLTIRDCMNLEYFRKVSEPTMMLQQKEKEDDFNNINVINMSSLICLIISKWPKVGMLLLPGVEGCVNNNNFASLRQLSIHDCDVLESLSFPERGLPNLRLLRIRSCVNLQSLAMTNQILQSLESLQICICESLESMYFPERGGSTPNNLRWLTIIYCSNLRRLPFFDQNSQTLSELTIYDCPCIMTSFHQGNWNLPPNLIKLTIGDNGKLEKPLSEWDLQRLTSLRQFEIGGGYPELVSFPPPDLLPSTLTSLWIEKLPNLESIPLKALQNLTTLQHLAISHCPKLRSLPKEGLPSTLLSLELVRCPHLRERCQGDYWPNIPYVNLDALDTRHF
ncbi:putative disease resistance protein At3g14460 [Cornus florida]|uniref:putative disease resistance protein At3g14460 n=1 Tax=Cornus florida TaxID=4283 RepID=UPI0028A0327E|nr:putative disease resistance protein At3g14460 [Cornus florida]